MLTCPFPASEKAEGSKDSRREENSELGMGGLLTLTLYKEALMSFLFKSYIFQYLS